MPVDFNVFHKVKTVADFDREAEQHALKRQLVQSQIGKMQQLDATKLGETAFLKAAQGLPLSPQEQAAAQLLDAKSGGIMFDPVMGGVVQKPRISDKIGIPGLTPAGGGSVPQMGGSPVSNPFPGQNLPVPQLPAMPPIDGINQEPNQFEAAYQAELAAAAGNPKLQQSIKQKYATSKLAPNESEAKAAGFADRMAISNPVIDETAGAGTSATKNVLNNLPFGNYLTGADFQKFDQAGRAWVNAQQRRESGAAIPPYEWEQATKLYIPVPGDTPEVIAQKAQARATAEKAMQVSAGASYKPKSLYEKGEDQFNNSKPKVVDYTEFFK